MTKLEETIAEGAASPLPAGDERFRAILEALPVAVYATDAAGKITFYNEAAVELVGRRPVLGSDSWCVTWRLKNPDGSPLPHDQCPMAIALKEQRANRGATAIAVRPDGSEVWFRPYPTPLFDTEGRMVGAVNMLVDITEQRVASLKVAQMAAIVSSSDDAIISKNLDGVIVTWNAGAERLFGYSASEAIGRSITMLIPADRDNEETAIIERLRRGERVDHYETERKRKDGSLVDISLTVSPVKDETGRIVGASKVARDISERKQAESLQRLLTEELNHRVKNTLATVQAIAHLTARNARDPSEFVESFTGRLLALAKTHTLLTQTSWAGADLGQLALEQLLLGASEDKRIWLSGPSMLLEPQASLQLSLVLHELATNARKYGALSVEHGRLSLSWSIEASETRELLLSWRESDGPPVVVPGSSGFGTKLMHESLRAQGGQVSIRYASNGVVCDIRLPLHDGGGGAYRTPKAEQVREYGNRASARKARVLIVDDEPLIAMDVAAALTERNYEIVGPAGTLASAEALIEAGGIDAALLDSNLGGRRADDLAAALMRHNIPFAFLTGHERKDLPSAFRHAPLVRKPFDRGELIRVVADLTRPREGVARLRGIPSTR